MAFIDTYTATSKLYDVCVVGSGAAGLATALACTRGGLSVIILEAGGEPPVDARNSARAQTSDGSERHQENGSAFQAYGGSSHRWDGRCAPVQENAVSAAPSAAWPILLSDLSRWHGAAAEFLGCSEGFEKAPPVNWAAVEGQSVTDIEQTSPVCSLTEHHSAALLAATGPEILLNAPVARLVFADYPVGEQRVEAADIVQDGRPKRVWAKRFVLACGGLGAARLLLSEQRWRPQLFGGADGRLGRGLAQRFEGVISSIEFANRRDVPAFESFRIGKGAWAQRRWRVDGADCPIRFWVNNLKLADPVHASGVLSLKYLTLGNAAVGQQALFEQNSEAIADDGRASWGRHVLNIALDPLRTFGELVRGSGIRMSQGRRRRPILARSRRPIYALRYQSEHALDASSRILLSDKADKSWLPELNLVTAREAGSIDAVLQAHDRMAKVLEADGVARLSFQRPREQLGELVATQTRGRIDPIGVTMMADGPHSGVVDTNCRAFGTQNLFVATSGVIPTTAAASPTFTLVALAHRLAAHIRADIRESDAASLPTATAISAE